MIHVLASIGVNPGKRAEFIALFKENIPAVLNETGCVEYIPTIDTNSGIDTQWKDENVVTIIEKWETIEALRDHLVASHMVAFQKNAADLIEDISLTILEDA